MKSKALLAVILIGVLTACKPSPLTGEVVLKPGQSAGNASQSVEVTFVEILEDSRCPADAMCVWQGNVKVLIEVGYGTEVQQYTLTLGEMLEGDVNSITVGEYTITLVQVDPYPLASQPTDPADYRVTLEIKS
jgi:hypothetical protein